VAVIPRYLYPLRDRKEDIPLLVDFFLQKMKASITISFTDKAMNYLQNYDWPGNVRELENVVEQSLILRCSDQIQVEDLPPHISQRGIVATSIFLISINLPLWFCDV
jgi:two-component system NtrC family response regulator